MIEKFVKGLSVANILSLLVGSHESDACHLAYICSFDLKLFLFQGIL